MQRVRCGGAGGVGVQGVQGAGMWGAEVQGVGNRAVRCRDAGCRMWGAGVRGAER